jgi:hypothetical protein
MQARCLMGNHTNLSGNQGENSKAGGVYDSAMVR